MATTASVTPRNVLAPTNGQGLRIGIDTPGEIPLSNYVLGRFRPDQKPLIEPTLDDAADAVAVWARQDLQTAMNQFNRKDTA